MNLILLSHLAESVSYTSPSVHPSAYQAPLKKESKGQAKEGAEEKQRNSKGQAPGTQRKNNGKAKEMKRTSRGKATGRERNSRGKAQEKQRNSNGGAKGSGQVTCYMLVIAPV